MKVRMLTTKAGPDGGWNAGDILERGDGDKLVTEGAAVPHEPAAKVEHAVAPPQRAPDPAPAPAPPVAAVEPTEPVPHEPRHPSPKGHKRRQ